ncbi:hypothetical protein MKW98_015058, partial [Papaver atlanticum]
LGQLQESTYETNSGHIIDIPSPMDVNLIEPHEHANQFIHGVATIHEVNEIMELGAHGNQIHGVATIHEVNEIIELNPHGNQIHSVDTNGHVSDDQISPHPNPSNSVSDQGEPQVTPPVDLKSESKIALGLFTVSAGSLVVVVVVIFGDKKIELSHPVVFQAFTSLSLISLISASTMFLLTLKSPNIPYLAKAVRFTMCVSLDSLFFAYTWAASVLLLGKLGGTIVAMVSLSVFFSINIIVCVVL